MAWPDNPVLASVPSWAGDDPLGTLATIALLQATQGGDLATR